MQHLPIITKTIWNTQRLSCRLADRIAVPADNLRLSQFMHNDGIFGIIEIEPRHVRFRIVYYMLGILFATGILSVSNWLIKEYRMRDTMFAHTGGELISHAGGILCNHRIVLFRQFFQLSSGALLHGLDNFRNGSCSSNFYINIERFHTKQDLLTEKCIRYTWGKSNIAASARIGNSIGIRIVFIDLRFCRSRVQVFQLNLR